MNKALIVGLLSLGIAGAALAQEDQLGAVKGDSFVSLSGSLTFTGGSSSVFVLSNYGRYFTDQFVGQVTNSYNYTPGSGTTASTGLSVRYDLTARQKTTPYVGVGLSIYALGGQSSTSLLGDVGVDFHITKRSSFFVEADAFKPQGSDSQVLVSFGIRYFIPSGS